MAYNGIFNTLEDLRSCKPSRKKLANASLRSFLARNKIRYWQLGEVLEVSENTIVRKMRTELSPDDNRKFMAAAEAIIRKRLADESDESEEG